MDSVLISVTCPNCGNAVMFNQKKYIAGGMYETCRNCSCGVSINVDWFGETPKIYGVRGVGGSRKR